MCVLSAVFDLKSNILVSFEGCFVAVFCGRVENKNHLFKWRSSFEAV